jgi:hypothetical protein
MSRFIPRRPSPAMVVAVLALVVAMSGTALAAEIITSNAQVGTGTINARNVIDDSLTGTDIAESTLGAVPSALTAGSAPIAGLTSRNKIVDNPPNTLSVGNLRCPAGTHVLSGGALALGVGIDQSLVSSAPIDGSHWTIEMQNHSDLDGAFAVYVTCANAKIAVAAPRG